jgi:1-acyl-sn-glycerol-3-phosphate acyltransferase
VADRKAKGFPHIRAAKPLSFIMHSEITPQEFDRTTMTDSDAAKSSTRRRPRFIGRLWFCWSWFVAGALLLVLAPPILLVARLTNRRDWVYPWALFGARTWLRLSGVKMDVKGLELLDPKQPYVFIANHWSYLDAAPLFAYTGRRMGLVGKKELLKAPILGYGMGFVNVIAIDRSNRERAVESIRIATERLRSGISFGVCAEGTRARPGQMLPFKKGAFHMAVKAGVPIVPIAFKNSDQLMGKGTGEAWPGTFEMVLFEPVKTDWVTNEAELQKLVDQVQGIIMKEIGVERLTPRLTK